MNSFEKGCEYYRHGMVVGTASILGAIQPALGLYLYTYNKDGNDR